MYNQFYLKISKKLIESPDDSTNYEFQLITSTHFFNLINTFTNNQFHSITSHILDTKKNQTTPFHNDKSQNITAKRETHISKLQDRSEAFVGRKPRFSHPRAQPAPKSEPPHKKHTPNNLPADEKTTKLRTFDNNGRPESDKFDRAMRVRMTGVRPARAVRSSPTGLTC